MTDQTEPGPSSPDAPANPVTQAPAEPPPSGEQPSAPVPPPSGEWTPPAPAGRGGKLRPAIIIGVIVVILGVILFAVRNNVDADDLKVGDCFDIPTGTSIQTVEKHPCTESHNGEVFFVGEYPGDTYPISLSLDTFVEDSCVPAFETYVGRAIDSEPELSVGYFYPSRDGWDGGDKTITCYATQPDESPTTESVKG